MRDKRLLLTRASRLVPWLVGLAGTAILLASAAKLARDEAKHREHAFAQAVDHQLQAVETAIEADESVLSSVVGLFNASQEVTGGEFRTFVMPYFHYFRRNCFYRALAWAPRVPAGQRQACENYIRDQGVLDFRIAPAADETPPALRQECFPLAYVEPFTPNRELLGLDLASLPACRAALNRARDTGVAAATGRITLHQAGARGSGMLTVMPLYAREGVPGDLDERRSRLTGFVVGIYRLPDVFSAMLDAHRHRGVSVVIFDDSDASSSGILFGSDDSRAPLRMTKRLRLGGRDFLAIWQAGRTFGGETHDTLAWLIIAVGAGLVVSGVIIILLLQSRMRQAEDESDRRRLVLHTSMDGYFLMDFHGRLLEVNAAYCDMVGYSREELLTMSISDLEAREEPDEVARHIHAVHTAGRDRFETRHRRNDSEVVDVEISTSVCRVSGHEFLVAFARDVTERKRGEEALRNSERRYRTLIESLPQKVFLKDRDSVYLSCNANYARDLGVTPEEIVGRVDYGFFPKELADKYRADDKRVMDSGEIEEMEERYIVDGRQAWVHTVKRPVRDETGNVVAVLGIFWDITERKQAELALERQNRRLEALNLIAAAAGSTLDIGDLAKRATDAVVTVTGALHGGLHLYSAQDDALVICARSEMPDMAFPQALDQLPVGDDEGGPASAFRSGEIGIEAVREAIEHLEPDSPLRTALEVLQHQQRLSQMLFVPLLAAGRAVGLMCLCYPEGHKVPTDDVKSLETARNAIGVAIDHALLYQANQQRAEQLASANQELKSLDQMKNDFISLVGHELRTPLAGILGYAEFLLDEDLSPDESREFAATIHRESERLTRMVNAVLDLNKMEAGRIEYRKVAEDFNDIVRAAATSMEAAAGRRNQRLRLALAPGPMTAEFDPDRIQQVVLNLLSNAVKFSRENSEIEVGTRTDDGSVIAWVRDQGMGIGPEDISRVFEKFVQADHGSKRLEGTGLGLPICKGIVEGGHAGQMWAESPGPGQGATFYFRIPRHAADASADR